MVRRNFASVSEVYLIPIMWKDMQTRRSISGYVVYLEDVPIMHQSATQKTVALSVCEAEMNWQCYVHKI